MADSQTHRALSQQVRAAIALRGNVASCCRVCARSLSLSVLADAELAALHQRQPQRRCSLTLDIRKAITHADLAQATGVTVIHYTPLCLKCSDTRQLDAVAGYWSVVTAIATRQIRFVGHIRKKRETERVGANCRY